MYVFAVRKFPDSDFFILFSSVCGAAGGNKCDIGSLLIHGSLGYGLGTDCSPEGKTLVGVRTSCGRR